jgi:predicted SAM-dependent methyltransferase
MGIRRLLRDLTPPIIALATQELGAALKRPLTQRRLAGETKIHLACGSNVLEGWANVDLTGNRRVVGWNLTQRLPVRSESIDFIFCEHFIEHISLEDGKRFLSECRRMLRPGGVLRVSTPSLTKLVEEYMACRLSEWTDVGWKPTTPCRLLNEGFRLWGHQFIYDVRELRKILEEAGYCNITEQAWHESAHPELRGLECRPFHGEVIFQATK